MKTNLLMSTFPGGLPGVKIFPNHQYSLYSLLILIIKSLCSTRIYKFFLKGQGGKGLNNKNDQPQ